MSDAALALVFARLEPLSLRACLGVSRRWRCVAEAILCGVVVTERSLLGYTDRRFEKYLWHIVAVPMLRTRYVFGRSGRPGVEAWVELHARLVRRDRDPALALCKLQRVRQNAHVPGAVTPGIESVAEYELAERGVRFSPALAPQVLTVQRAVVELRMKCALAVLWRDDVFCGALETAVQTAKRLGARMCVSDAPLFASEDEARCVFFSRAAMPSLGAVVMEGDFIEASFVGCRTCVVRVEQRCPSPNDVREIVRAMRVLVTRDTSALSMTLRLESAAPPARALRLQRRVGAAATWAPVVELLRLPVCLPGTVRVEMTAQCAQLEACVSNFSMPPQNLGGDPLAEVGQVWAEVCALLCASAQAIRRTGRASTERRLAAEGVLLRFLERSAQAGAAPLEMVRAQLRVRLRGFSV